MSASGIHVHVEDVIPRPVPAVFAAVVDPRRLSQYFTSSASAPLEEGKRVTWTFADVGAQISVEVRSVRPDHAVVFAWGASGEITEVTMTFEAAGPAATKVVVAESGWPMEPAGVQKALGQNQGWTDFINCLKAYLLFGVNLRRGVRAEVQP